MVNFFGLNNIIFADLPGYGYNVASKGVEGKWISLWAHTAKDLISCLFLIDIRRDIADYEVNFLNQLNENAPVIIVLTKSDKLKQGERTKRTKATKALPKGSNKAHMTIAIFLKRLGSMNLIPQLRNFVSPVEEEETLRNRRDKLAKVMIIRFKELKFQLFFCAHQKYGSVILNF